jgi:hypothetical protein
VLASAYSYSIRNREFLQTREEFYMSQKFKTRNSKIYHTYRECPKLNTHRRIEPVEEISELEDFTKLQKCKLCRGRDNSSIPLIVGNVFTQLQRYRNGVLIMVPEGFRVQVRNQPALLIDHQGNWRIEQ